MDRKKIIYTVSTILLTVLTMAFAISFAYIGKPTAGPSTNVSMNIIPSGMVIFKYTGATTMSLNVTEASLDPSNAANNYTKYAITSSTNTTVNLTSNSTYFPNGVTCNYDIIYTPTVAYVQTPAATAAGLRELVFRGKIGSTYYINDVNIAGSDPITVYSTTISTSSSASTKTVKWQFYVRFYNLNIDQSPAQGQNPTGVVSIKNGKCEANSA